MDRNLESEGDVYPVTFGNAGREIPIQFKQKFTFFSRRFGETHVISKENEITLSVKNLMYKLWAQND